MYKDTDINILKDNYPEIDKKINEILIDTIEPTRTERDNVIKFLEEFIINNKRIIYGSKAHNMAILYKDQKDAFQSKNDYNDYDFYSVTPIQDIVHITETLYKQGFKDIFCKEAIHDESFSIFVNTQLYCDITYMPKYIYENIPTINISGFRCIHPHVALLDYLRMFCDPLLSSFRWVKSITRAYLLNKHYPFKIKSSVITVIETDYEFMMNVITKIIADTIIHNLIFIGDYAYNYYQYKANTKNYIPIQQFTLITTNYIKDVNYIYDILLKYDSTITYKEYHPFFQFTGKRITFYKNNKQILSLIDNNNMCIPYFKQKFI